MDEEVDISDFISEHIQEMIEEGREIKKFNDYCAAKNYSPEDISAIRAIHKLHVNYENGNTAGHTPIEALEHIANSPESERMRFIKIGETKRWWVGNSILKLSDDLPYARRMLETYQFDIKPGLGL